MYIHRYLLSDSSHYLTYLLAVGVKTQNLYETKIKLLKQRGLNELNSAVKEYLQDPLAHVERLCMGLYSNGVLQPLFGMFKSLPGIVTAIHT